jgi:hypothetical protein
MGNALDTFKAQQAAVEALHARLADVGALVAGLKADVDGLRLGHDLMATLETEQQWLIRTERLLRDVQDWRDGESRRARRAVRWRWALPCAFALAASAATGAGLLWAWRPYASELERLRAQAAFAELVEGRVAVMTAAERQEFERLMKLSPSRH